MVAYASGESEGQQHPYLRHANMNCYLHTGVSRLLQRPTKDVMSESTKTPAVASPSRDSQIAAFCHTSPTAAKTAFPSLNHQPRVDSEAMPDTDTTVPVQPGSEATSSSIELEGACHWVVESPPAQVSCASWYVKPEKGRVFCTLISQSSFSGC